MKNINNIFENNKDLLSNDAVRELIEYCQELEDEIIENNQDKKFSFEDKLTILVNELYRDIDDLLEEEKLVEEFPFRDYPKPDFKSAFINLKKYFQQFSRDYNYDFNKN